MLSKYLHEIVTVIPAPLVLMMIHLIQNPHLPYILHSIQKIIIESLNLVVTQLSE